MKANFQIDEYGKLSIERKGELERQYCPRATFSADEETGPCGRSCGHWCPLFGELKEFDVNDEEVSSLRLCEAVTIEGKCTDERK